MEDYTAWLTRRLVLLQRKIYIHLWVWMEAQEKKEVWGGILITVGLQI